MTDTSLPPSDFISVLPQPATADGTSTHSVENVPSPLPDLNLFTGDEVLTAAVEREGIGWITDLACETGRITGSRRMREIAHIANTEMPALRTHDGRGNRIDIVDYHPAYHQLMAETYRTGAHSVCWTTKNPRPQLGRSVLYYLWNQVENGVISCPNGMSFAIAPLLKSDPEVGDRWLSKVLATDYDPRPIPTEEKTAATVAMAMTEKQGGSDLRSNTTRAEATETDREYLLTGHKYFFSAPMSDIFLVTAKTSPDAGLSLFVVPRVLDSGERNRLFIQRLKPKLGNHSNATSEIELDGALGYRIGEEGRGVRQFVKYMTHYIRMSLSLGSAGIMRAAVTLAIHHTTGRNAFGSPIRDLPMMRNTLADIAIESEAATLLGLRVARAVDDADTSTSEAHLNRILVPVAKFWNCRRTTSVTLEALECHGGMGYIEDQAIARLHREAPLNSIWEGTSAMMTLDVMRSTLGGTDTIDALLAELHEASGADRHYDAYVSRLEKELAQVGDDFEANGRYLMSMMATAAQGSLLLRHSIPEVADAFCASRMGGAWAHEYGTLHANDDVLRTIVDRAALNTGDAP